MRSILTPVLADITRTAAPAGYPVTLDEAKAHLRVDIDDEDALIGGLIASATFYLDGYEGLLGRSILTQTWKLYLPGFHVNAEWRTRGAQIYPNPTAVGIALPAPPLQSVSSVAYVDSDGNPQTLTSGIDYQVVDGRLAQIWPMPGVAWPETQRENRRAVTITFVAGYGADSVALAAAAPGLREAILLLVGHWYHNREAVVGVENRDSSTELPLGVGALIAPYRLYPV